MNKAGKSEAYRAAGVDIDLATSLLQSVKSKISATRRPEALAPIGGFGGLFQIDLTKWRQPVMVTSIDGVGTKLMIAAMMEKYTTVGYDIVNHCINDIAVQGAEPVYFMDYIGIGKLRSPLYEDVLIGIADACLAMNVTLLGGETAEMPGMYGDDFDLVGCITGIVERDAIITGDNIRPGDIVIGMASSGLHTNGYSLARQVLFQQAGYTVDTTLPELGGGKLGDALLEPHRCYWPAIRDALAAGLPLNGIAHITGGGLYDNVPRVLPDGIGVDFQPSALPSPPIFGVIQRAGDIEPHEMYRVFNMGVGMVWLVPPAAVDQAQECCAKHGITAAVIGQTKAGKGVNITLK
ncbi:MAG: phosphoribosylformylglycinamidine cyclo-ligase [Lentisphaerae bacterium]|jgi:phosphoribosylformylglycinamidine cyclo-ligase|nr:phosphoribosylformylglycinamidine cyclo-ligase [Lentisphaerota bacterium]